MECAVSLGLTSGLSPRSAIELRAHAGEGRRNRTNRRASAACGIALAHQGR